MNLSLVLIGAHDGSKISNLIVESARHGNVLLVEPVPYLFKRLTDRFSAIANIKCLNEVISDVNGEVDFYMPTPDANEITFFGDQLGSLNPEHAVLHHQMFKQKIQKIRSNSRTMISLIETFEIRHIDVLWTDMEGYDATFLLGFPFHLIKPKRILFEAKHSDGVMKIGKKFAALLLLLDELKYSVRIQDEENCLATLVP